MEGKPKRSTEFMNSHRICTVLWVQLLPRENDLENMPGSFRTTSTPICWATISWPDGDGGWEAPGRTAGCRASEQGACSVNARSAQLCPPPALLTLF